PRRRFGNIRRLIRPGRLSLRSFWTILRWGGRRPPACPTRWPLSKSSRKFTPSLVMIITRSPLRITLGGGGTDLPSYYSRYGGFLIAGAIDKYVYVTVMRPFVRGIFLKYSKLENVEDVEDIQHPIVREAIRMLGFKTPQIEITTLADIPAGTGLGSSGSFSTALLKA